MLPLEILTILRARPPFTALATTELLKAMRDCKVDTEGAATKQDIERLYDHLTRQRNAITSGNKQMPQRENDMNIRQDAELEMTDKPGASTKGNSEETIEEDYYFYSEDEPELEKEDKLLKTKEPTDQQIERSAQAEEVRPRKRPTTQPRDESGGYSRMAKRKPEKNTGYNPLKDREVRKQLAALRRSEPYFVTIVMLLQTACFAYVCYYYGGLAPLVTNPMMGPPANVLINFGALYTPCIRLAKNWNATTPCLLSLPQTAGSRCTHGVNAYYMCSQGALPAFTSVTQPNQWYRWLITLLFTNGVVDLCWSLMILWRFGMMLEKAMGSWRIALVWLISGAGAAAAQALLNPFAVNVTGVSASTGIMAYAVIDLIDHYPLLWNQRREPLLLGAIVSLTLLIGFLPWIDNYGHLAGFFIGLMVSTLVHRPIFFSKNDRRKKVIIYPIIGGLLALGVTVPMYILFYKGYDASNIPGLRWLSCWPSNDLTWCGAAPVPI